MSVLSLSKLVTFRGVALSLSLAAGLTAACDGSLHEDVASSESAASEGYAHASADEADKAVDAPDAGPRRVCPSNRNPDGSWVKVDGFDVSDYQFTDWDKVARDNPHQKYAFARVSAGLVRVDTRFTADWAGAKRVGLIRGAYQYFKPSQSAIAQADLFLSRMNAEGGFEAEDFPPVLDVETTNDMPTETVVCRIKTWLARVERATKRVPLIYTSHLYSNLLGPEIAARHALWISNYVGTPSVTCPRMPASWDKWTLWQYSDRGPVPGVYKNGDRDAPGGGYPATGDGGLISTGYDVNYFDGTLDQLKGYIASTTSDGDVADPPPLAHPPVVSGAATTAGGPVDCADDGCCVAGP